MVTDRSGNAPDTPGHGLGLYLHDCRFLSTLQLSVAGVILEPRATDDSRGNVALIELGNDVDIGLSDGEVLGAPQAAGAPAAHAGWRRDGPSSTI